MHKKNKHIKIITVKNESNINIDINQLKWSEKRKVNRRVRIAKANRNITFADFLIDEGLMKRRF